MATSDSPLNVPNVTLAVARGASNPPTTGVPSINSVVDNGEGTLTISGSNFGSKAQAAPRILDRVAEVWNNGVQQTVGTLTDGMDMAGSEFYPVEPPGAMGSLYASARGTSIITTSKPQRLPAVSAHYYLNCKGDTPGADAHGLELIETQDDGSPEKAGRPFDLSNTANRKIYLAYWLKPSKRITDANWNRNFMDPWQPGTSYAVGDFVSGVTESRVGFQATKAGVSGASEPAFPDFTTVVNDKSQLGVNTTDDNTVTWLWVTLDPSSTKYLRVFDNPDRAHWRSVWSVGNIAALAPDGTGMDAFLETTDFEVPANKWSLCEFYLDVDGGSSPGTGIIKTFLDTKLVQSTEVESQSNGLGFYISGFPFESNPDGPMDFELQCSEVYADSTPQRVLVANAANWADVTHCEILRPEAWSNSQVVAADDLGVAVSGNWLYMVGIDGSINQSGAPL